MNEPQTQLLIVDDEVLFAKAVARRLNKVGYQCTTAASLGAAQAVLAQRAPDLILLDMRLPDGSGLDFLQHLRTNGHGEVGVVVLTAYGEIEDAVEAMKLQALDYLKKPIDLEELQLTLAKALDQQRLNQRLNHSRQREQHARAVPKLLGESAALENLRGQIERIAALADKAQQRLPTVLILGETGTGKDLVARCLHHRSVRADQPFVHVDCAALPKDLIEAELFGHEKGAFTGAHQAREGLIEAAEQGTVFLDELAELPLELQTKLLAVLERRVLRRVGSSRERSVSAWFIAATNRDLEQMVAAGSFRSDLYYRLKILSLHLPALRDREDDAVVLAQHFAAKTASHYGLPESELTAAAQQALRHYRWPGNVRELVNVLERAIILSAGEPITPTELALPSGDDSQPMSVPLDDTMTLDDAEIKLIEQALQRCKGNVSQAARELGITRMALRYRLQKHNIR